MNLQQFDEAMRAVGIQPIYIGFDDKTEEPTDQTGKDNNESKRNEAGREEGQ